MRAVTGPRVQLLCVDASPRLLVFGSSIGSVYVFERRARDGEALDADAEPDAANADAHDSSPVASHAPEDGPARFLERFMVETFAGGSATRPVTRARLDERRARLALAFDDGEVVVVSFRDPLSSTEHRAGSSSGRYVAGIPNGHKGARVTSMAWSAGGDALISGDDAGAVSVVRLDGPDAGAHTVRFDAPVVQVAFCDFGGGAALVSTTTQLSLLHRANGFKKTPIGAKPRDGAFGASAHAWTRAAVPEETLAQLEAEEAGTTETTEGLFSSASSGDAKGETKDDEKSKRATRTPCRVRSEYWMFGARPGRRLWVCRAATAGELSEAKVLATVRPSIPEASAPPGSRLPAPTAPVPKKWEFGALHALGPCVLSVSEKTIAVVDVVSAAVLAWYPLAPPRGRGRGDEEETPRNAEGVGAPRDLATRGARAFALGADGGVWCLRVPANEAQLAAASAALGVLAARRGSEKKTRDDGETNAAGTSPRETDPAAHLERIERRVRSVDRQSRPSEETSETSPATSPAASPAAVGEAISVASRESPPPSSSERLPEGNVADDVSGDERFGERLGSGPETRAPTSPSTEIGFITRARNRPTSPFPVMVDGVVIDVVTEKTLRRAERSARGEDGERLERGAAAEAAEATGRGEEDRRDDDERTNDDEARVVVGDAGVSEPLREADRALREPSDVRGDDLGEESARSPSRAVESEDTPASEVSASDKISSPASEVSADRDRNPGDRETGDRDRDPPFRVKTRPEDEGDAASPSSPSGSAFSASESPRATETNQLFPADLNPWWMRLIGCGGCGPVRSNKQEKGGLPLGMRW